MLGVNMNRSGGRDSDYHHMATCYESVSNRKKIVIESSTGPSFPGLKMVKIYKQRMGAGADLIFFGKDIGIESDNGNGGTVMTAQEGEKTIHVATTKSNVQIKVVGNDGNIEEEFITTLPPKYNTERSELIIIQVEQI